MQNGLNGVQTRALAKLKAASNVLKLWVGDCRRGITGILMTWISDLGMNGRGRSRPSWLVIHFLFLDRINRIHLSDYMDLLRGSLII